MSAATTPLIATDGVCKAYNLGRADEVRAVDSVTMAVDRGEVLVLEGPSGSGKTSLLSLIGCMSRPTQGRIVVDGRDVAKLAESELTRERRQRFGFIFQQFHLIADLPAAENVLLPLYPTGVAFSEMRRRAGAVLDRLGMGGKAARRVRTLSGGEQQRVAIARALVNDPQVVVADEPTAHLDRKLADELLEILVSIHGEGRTVVIATHDPRVFEHPIVDRILEMRDGRIVGERRS
ncbi:MAG TPA: ABC transporter ATP-binding protein [Thermoanaerobaculales bacterium]|nr:ABC transporter ATP-binding protein [Thermoanaerobaculales bacterium]HQN94738.1 ABC transporter ATP-binding protein [Thermoanaerobaculales bacterium]HQP42381.1 ABC transporter ATP-binding protein [Thermoanaerobaculales bacterium]